MRQRIRWFSAASAACFVAGVALPAAAQSPGPTEAPPPAPSNPAAAPPAVGEVIVQGAPPAVRTSIDRQSYSVANDLQSTTGSIGDALRNVPSLEVDVSGNVSLRGDSNVTVLIDGKPSGMFRGEGRGQALQSLPANQIERVEVITNPSAAFDPDGSAGIINLVTRKNRTPGASGSVRANLGSAGRWNGGGNAAWRKGPVAINGDGFVRHDSIRQTSEQVRETRDPVTGMVRESERNGGNSGRVNLTMLRAGLDYDLDATTRLSLEASRRDIDILIDSAEAFDETVGGVTSRAFDRFTLVRQQRPETEGAIRFRKTFGEGHTLDVDLSHEREENDSDRTVLNRNRAPIGPDLFERFRLDSRTDETDVDIDYERPLVSGGKLKLGLSLDAEDSVFDNVGEQGPGPGATVVDPNRTNLFRFDQDVYAAFGSYERPVGDVTVLAGLRVETVRIDANQVTQAIRASARATDVYPSLHLRRQIGETRSLSASYSRRIQRPQPQDYNPFVTYQDERNLRAGNPNLKPQVLDSFEVGYQHREAGTVLLATAYYRDGRDAVNDVTRDIGGGVFLTTRENVGQFRSAGLELVANGRIVRGLTYNVSGNLLWSEIDGRGLGFGSGLRDAATVFGRANLSWQASDRDFLQLSGFVNGKRLTPQGYSEPTGMLNLGYRRKVSDTLSAVLTVQDVLGTFRDRRVIETADIREVQRFKPRQRGVFVGFTYTFGGGRPRDPGFDFGAGGGAPPT
ncbi:MAG: outer membrane beta-barrel family protein [Phenylobacterium sp.]|nr:outer membrane beta-barrel family protein [Phenylobacterium sp.]